MRPLLTHRRTRITARAIAAITFCDACSEVGTPTCRRDALRERTYLKALESVLYRH